MHQENCKIQLGEQAGLLWTWWPGDPLPVLPPLPTLRIIETESNHQMAALMGISEADVVATLQEGHRAYIAYLSTGPVAYGWSASNRASFGEGRVKFHVPARDRYLYNFVTLPTWRGMGLYPRLLQAILKRETDGRGEGQPERFWIIHQFANVASARGIGRAGFRIASEVHFSGDDSLVLVCPTRESERARAGAELLGLPLIKETERASAKE